MCVTADGDWAKNEKIVVQWMVLVKLLAIALRTIAIAIAIVAKKAIEYCNMQ